MSAVAQAPVRTAPPMQKVEPHRSMTSKTPSAPGRVSCRRHQAGRFPETSRVRHSLSFVHRDLPGSNVSRREIIWLAPRWRSGTRKGMHTGATSGALDSDSAADSLLNEN